MNALQLVFFATLQIIVTAHPGIVEMVDTNFVDFNTLTRQTLRFKCKPQPRAFLAKDYLAETLQASEKLLINNIILYRCEKDSGCCFADGEVCGPKTSEPVTIQLKANNSLTGKLRYITTKNTFNHTSCECGTDSPPKREDARLEPLTSAGLTFYSNMNRLCCFFVIIHFFTAFYLF